jgi:hypothetical protein
MLPETVRANRLLDSRQPSFTEVSMRQIWLAVVVALSLPFASLATGAQPPRSADSRPFKPEELEQIVAPIVQYPDPLLAQIFMASTYPLEVIQAARFAKAHPSLKGDALNEELKKSPWTNLACASELPWASARARSRSSPGCSGSLRSVRSA